MSDTNESLWRFTDVFKRIVAQTKEGKTTIICYGGSSSSKTISIMQYLTIKAIKADQANPIRITFSSESMPVIRKTMFPDWKTHVMQGLYEDERFNKTEMYYTFPNGSIIQWIPADDAARWHGMRQDYCYFDELYYVPRAVFDQADIRTAGLMFASFNPVGNFWVQDMFSMDHVYVDHSTYKDNPYLSKKIGQALERRANIDQNFYDVYVLGKFGLLEGAVFKETNNWFVTDNDEHRYPDPNNVKKLGYGLDFGFSIDPTTVIEVCYSGGDLYLRQLVWETGLTNQDIAKKIRGLTNQVVADSAEPKSIAELRRDGCHVLPAKKGRDSITFGINVMKQFRIFINKDSIDLIKEFRNYRWEVNRLDEQLAKPIDKFNHGIDASRYIITHMFAGRSEFTL